MQSITNLYVFHHKYYDFKVDEEAEVLTMKSTAGGAKSFCVHHADGTTSEAWMRGEHKFTYDYQEILDLQREDAEKKVFFAKRNKAMAIIKSMSEQELEEFIASKEV